MFYVKTRNAVTSLSLGLFLGYLSKKLNSLLLIFWLLEVHIDQPRLDKYPIDSPLVNFYLQNFHFQVL